MSSPLSSAHIFKPYENVACKKPRRRLRQRKLILQYFFTISYTFYHIQLFFFLLHSSFSSTVIRQKMIQHCLKIGFFGRSPFQVPCTGYILMLLKDVDATQKISRERTFLNIRWKELSIQILNRYLLFFQNMI